MRKQLAWVAVLVLVGLAFTVAIENVFSEPFHTCINQERAKQQADTAKKDNGTIGVLIITQARCTGGFVHDYHGAFTALFTLVLAAFTGTLWWATYRMREDTTAAAAEHMRHLRSIERAYITMSHITNPTREAIEFDRVNNKASIEIEVKNCGRTPGHITGGRMRLHRLKKDESLPASPDYTGTESIEIKAAYFLVSGGKFRLDLLRLPFATSTLEAIKKGDDILRLYGYLDYVDRFGKGHSARYARRYDPGRGGNNLVFETAPGYNDDVDRS